MFLPLLLLGSRCCFLPRIVSACAALFAILSSSNFICHSLDNKVNFTSSKVIVVRPYNSEPVKCSYVGKEANNIMPCSSSLSNLLTFFKSNMDLLNSSRWVLIDVPLVYLN